MGSREKKSQIRHEKKLRFSVPLFEKACPEPSRREGPGKIWDDQHLKSACVAHATAYSADMCNPREEQSARRMAFRRAATRSAICCRKSRRVRTKSVGRLN